jgi:hypothetical protein
MKMQIDLVVNLSAFLCNLDGWNQHLPDDGRLLPKHVGASIQNKAVMEICA